MDCDILQVSNVDDGSISKSFFFIFNELNTMGFEVKRFLKSIQKKFYFDCNVKDVIDKFDFASLSLL